MRRVLGCACAAVAVLFAAPAVAGAVGATPTTAATSATAEPKAWILVDSDSGTVLAGSQFHAPLPPASTVKVMTAITAIELLKPDARLKVSAEAAARVPMKIDMREGESWPLDVTLQSMLMVSANDAAYAIAENAGGSLPQFAEHMNATGRRLGMQDSTFADPAGLDDGTSFNDGSRSSAYDLAIAARNLLAVPQLAAIVSTTKTSFTDPRGSRRTLTNHVRFLNLYPGATGVKTGFTQEAGRTLIASATRNGRTMIAVVLNYTDHYAYAGRLLDQGFATPANARGTSERLPATDITPGSRIGRPASEGTRAASSGRAGQPFTGRNAASQGSDLPWGYLVLSAFGVVVVLVVWRRHTVRARRKARDARQRRIDAARTLSARVAIGMGNSRRAGSRR